MHALFELLKPVNGSEIVNYVWTLLMQLPTDKEMLCDMTTGVDAVEGVWERHLPADASAAMKLYALKLIEAQVSLDVRERGEEREREAKKRRIEDGKDSWCTSFVRSGGLEHLTQTLLKVDFEVVGAGDNILFPLRSITSLAKLTAFFLGEKADFGGGVRQVLLQHILSMISKTTEVVTGGGEGGSRSKEEYCEAGEGGEQCLLLLRAMIEADFDDVTGSLLGEYKESFDKALICGLLITPVAGVRVTCGNVMRETWCKEGTQEGCSGVHSLLVLMFEIMASCEKPEYNERSEELFRLTLALLNKVYSEDKGGAVEAGELKRFEGYFAQGGGELVGATPAISKGDGTVRDKLLRITMWLSKEVSSRDVREGILDGSVMIYAGPRA